MHVKLLKRCPFAIAILLCLSGCSSNDISSHPTEESQLPHWKRVLKRPQAQRLHRKMSGCYYSQPCKKRSSVNSNTLRDAQIWGIVPHIALAASGFSCASA